jgi:hypothetical protein
MLAILMLQTDTTAAEDLPPGKIDQPLSRSERTATARLTRLRSARFWWNEENRVIGASFKGIDANDQALALASQLPGIRTIVLVALPENRLTDNGLAPLAKLPNLELLGIYGNRITDQGVVHIQQLPSLRALALNTDVGDAALAKLSSLPRLENLDLTQSRITDASLAHLKSLPSLSTLILNGTAVTNAGVEQLAEIKTLQHLYLGNTAIDDAAVASLQRMDQLALLVIRDTRITASGIAALQAALLESCEIIHHSGRYRGERSAPVAMAHAPAAQTSWRPAK